MHFFYFDESGTPGKSKLYSAIGISSKNWQSALNLMVYSRRTLKMVYGIDPRKEFHATKLLNGRGNYSDTHKLTEPEQLEIVKFLFELLVGIPEVKILNAYGPDYKYLSTLEYLLKEINAIMAAENEDAKLFFDEGNEAKIRTLTRKLRRYNTISEVEQDNSEIIENGNNQTIHILEDPDFRHSSDSFFIQLADLVAYSIYRKEEPAEKFIRNGFSNYYKILKSGFVKHSSNDDCDGIIRYDKKAEPSRH